MFAGFLYKSKEEKETRGYIYEFELERGMSELCAHWIKKSCIFFISDLKKQKNCANNFIGKTTL